MTDTCTVETGLLKKHPCGAAAVTKCVNCEQALCAKHALPKMSAGKKVFLCQECARAWKAIGDIPPAAAATPPAAAPAPKPAAAPRPAPAAVPKPAPVAAPKPAPVKPQPIPESSGPLEFTPGKPPTPEPKPAPAPAPAAKPPPPLPAGGKTELSIEHSAPPEPKPGEKK